MRYRGHAFAASLALVAAGCGSSSKLEPLGDAVLERGRAVYLSYCSGCHGEKGDGKGPAARFLDPQPRDFTRGVFKFRSTPSGSLPTDEDLMRVITHGVNSTSMPPWQLLSRPERQAVVSYLKTFSKRWKESGALQPAMPLPGAPETVGTAESIRKGGGIYRLMKCAECHGNGGRGDGPAVKTLRDDKGRPIPPLDFTARTPKGGDTAADYYRAFATGLDGTPMPAFGDSLSETQRWDLVSYVMALRKYKGSLPPNLQAPPPKPKPKPQAPPPKGTPSKPSPEQPPGATPKPAPGKPSGAVPPTVKTPPKTKREGSQ